MTQATPATAIPELSPDTIATENRAARDWVNDDPNPTLGRPTDIPDAPVVDKVDEPVRELTAREKIAERAKASRNKIAEETDPESLTQNDIGEYVPPFVKKG